MKSRASYMLMDEYRHEIFKISGIKHLSNTINSNTAFWRMTTNDQTIFN